MRILLDTQVFLWVVTDSTLLTPAARQMLGASDGVYVSAASLWEIETKVHLGKVRAQLSELVDAIVPSGLRELPVRAMHAAAVAMLPMHHADPFDRLLVAQAVSEPMRLVTADKVLAKYSELVTLI